MQLKELMELTAIDRLMVVHRDRKNGRETGEATLVVLPSQFNKYADDEVGGIDTLLDTSSPSYDGSIQVKPVLEVIVLHFEE
jgi:hypothetical protein